jgi:hypothetical protein
MIENLGHKPDTMTHYFKQVILFLVTGCLIATKTLAGSPANDYSKETPVAESKTTGSATSGKLAGLPAKGHEAPHGKTHTPHLEELPHIHKFHKERLKKIRRYRSRYWLSSKIVLILCHLSLLLIAYLHATH